MCTVQIVVSLINCRRKSGRNLNFLRLYFEFWFILFVREKSVGSKEINKDIYQCLVCSLPWRMRNALKSMLWKNENIKRLPDCSTPLLNARGRTLTIRAHYLLPLSLPLPSPANVFNLLPSLFGRWAWHQLDTAKFVGIRKGEGKARVRGKQETVKGKNGRVGSRSIKGSNLRTQAAESAYSTGDACQALLQTCVCVCVCALKCRYFWLPQGVTYAKGATQTKTKCTCYTHTHTQLQHTCCCCHSSRHTQLT